MPKLIAYSFDYDACLARHGFDGDIIAHNQNLHDKLILKNAKYNKVKAYIGSNRQSKLDDDKNAGNGNGSAFQHIPVFARSIGAEFIPFLMADLYNLLARGTSFKDALKGEMIYGWLHDPSKISVLYAQIQQIALENPDDEIDFVFYDDKLNLINGLNDFFTANKHLIPKNVTLKLRHYAGDEITKKPSIIGEGTVNEYYDASIRRAGHAFLKSTAAKGNLFNVLGNVVDADGIIADNYNCGVYFTIESTLDILINSHVSEEIQAHMRAQKAIAEVIEAYTKYSNEECSFSFWHRHGETGRLRANAFLIQINNIDDPATLKTTVNNFINDEKNGNTHAHSLKTMLYQKLYKPELDLKAVSEELTEPSIFSKMYHSLIG